MNVEHEFLDFAEGLTWASLPNGIREAVAQLAGDALANAVVGRRAAETKALETASRALYGEGTSSVIAGHEMSLVAAVGMNAFQTTAYTMCDVYRPGLCHVTPEVVPAALAMAEREDVDGTRFLTAVAAGLEATTRLCQAFNYPAFRARGWHSPGISGALGASITAGLLAGLEGEILAGCVGLAGSQASGSFAAMGTMAVKFHQLRGAQAAVIAAVHAQHALTGPTHVLTANEGGLFRAFSDDPNPERLVEGLGEHWELREIALRPYPAASTLQSLINVLMECEVSAATVTQVHIELPDEAYRLGARVGWESELRAMQSARFVAAGTLLTRECWTDLFGEKWRGDAQLNTLARDYVDVVCNHKLIDGAVRVTLTTTEGVHRLGADSAVGDPRKPLTREQLSAKARHCFVESPVSLDFDVERIVHLERERSIAKLLADLRGS